MMHDNDMVVRGYEAGDTWNDDDQVVELEVKQPLDKVIPIRLPSDKWEALRQEANKLGIGPTTLARMWLLERLRHVTSDRVQSAASAAKGSRTRKRGTV